MLQLDRLQPLIPSPFDDSIAERVLLSFHSPAVQAPLTTSLRWIYDRSFISSQERPKDSANVSCAGFTQLVASIVTNSLSLTFSNP